MWWTVPVSYWLHCLDCNQVLTAHTKAQAPWPLFPSPSGCFFSYNFYRSPLLGKLKSRRCQQKFSHVERPPLSSLYFLPGLVKKRAWQYLFALNSSFNPRRTESFPPHACVSSSSLLGFLRACCHIHSYACRQGPSGHFLNKRKQVLLQ